MQWHPFLAGARLVHLGHMKLDGLVGADEEVYQATSVIPCRRTIYWRSADVSANGPSMHSPGRYIGAAGMNAPPTQWPVLVVKVLYRPSVPVPKSRLTS